jgi:hypothetical protein
MRRHAWQNDQEEEEDKNEIEIEKTREKFRTKKSHMDCVPTTIGDGKVQRNKNTKNSCELFGVCRSDFMSKKKNFFTEIFYRHSVFTN